MSMDDFAFTLDEQQLYFGQPEEENASDLLQREFDALRLQLLEDEFEGADDETIPRMTEEFWDSS